jgi:hypothetical protein
VGKRGPKKGHGGRPRLEPRVPYAIRLSAEQDASVREIAKRNKMSRTKVVEAFFYDGLAEFRRRGGER